jgi:hypothetical protein
MSSLQYLIALVWFYKRRFVLETNKARERKEQCILTGKPRKVEFGYLETSLRQTLLQHYQLFIIT